MIKHLTYEGRTFHSLEIDGNPYANMNEILTSIIPGSWDDYEQVLNSADDMVHDLDIVFIENNYWIPVQSISNWLFSFSLRNMQGDSYERFRIYRRDIEKVFRVVWALPVDNLILREVDSEWSGNDCDNSIFDIANIFDSYGIPEDQLQSFDDMEEVYSPVTYIEFICSSRECGPRGHLVTEQIQYIEELPNGDLIIDDINDILTMRIPPQEEYLDDYLDSINIFISSIASLYVGEL